MKFIFVLKQLNILLKSIQISNPDEHFNVYILHRELDEDDIFKLEKYCLKWGIKQNKWKKQFIYSNSR